MATIIVLLLCSTLVAAWEEPDLTPAEKAMLKYLSDLNKSLSTYYIYALLALAGVVLVYRSALRLVAHTRHLVSMTSGRGQRYFATTSSTVGWIKDHVLYAPTFRHKRATEIKFSKHVNLGTIPTRFQTLFIAACIAYNVFASVWNVPWSETEDKVLKALGDRTGILSVANLLPLVIMATIKNPFILLLDISYDTYNLMHRWLGRLCVLQAIVHTACNFIVKIRAGGLASVTEYLSHAFILHGFIATIGFIILFLHSPKLIRSWAYEIFLYVHIAVVVVTFAFLWMHIKFFPCRPLLIATLAIWGGTRLWRFATLAYRSWGRQSCEAAIQVLPGDALRISVTTPRPWTFKSGQSIFLTIPSVGWHTAHPFSVAWTEFSEPLSRSSSLRSIDEKRPTSRTHELEVEENGKQTYGLIVKAKGGMTKKLLERVERDGGAEGAIVNFKACIEGPYGSEHSMSSYGTVLLFASGVGVTHQIPYVKELVEGYANGTVAARRITLVWVIPSTDCLEWVRPWMHEILGMKGRRDVLKVVLYITRAGLSQPIRSPSETVRMLRGRPDVAAIMQKEAAEKEGCLGVSVCAGGGLADEVRRVSRVLCARGVNLDFIEEGFGCVTSFARTHPVLYEALLLIIQTTPLFITLTILSTRRALKVPRWQSVLLYYGGVAGFLGRYVLFITTIWWTLSGR
ncbi:hypothetical protein DV735_g328, partial [Chaetothyriales sp. CBS 134920]